MQPFQRSALRSARRIRPQLQKQPRRYAGDSQGANPENLKPEGGLNQHPTTESFGPTFYIVLATIPASIALYQFTRQGTSEQPWATRYITEKYAEYKDTFQRRNDFHTKAVEQAASDRLIFLNESQQGPRVVDLRFPEAFNIGSPWNVPAGQGSANIDHVIAKYEKEAYEANEKKLQQVRVNAVPIEQPLGETLIKDNPASGPYA
ncbi:hypothetical protein LTR78_009514 [Recurvomyces mirabilis]|uniref:Uncharacterized protein n=1 Tax=Recurvomyces mirabilis TaxID=574656 RepID=A0AAE0TTF3_9PEZI|nr:hypothetical protein LTR78_009514 [Recurvomyces mirabilis]KAK5150031.1 hypothetical protein LTS14_010503 [Recurvomyces mirabilis]